MMMISSLNRRFRTYFFWVLLVVIVASSFSSSSSSSSSVEASSSTIRIIRKEQQPLLDNTGTGSCLNEKDGSSPVGDEECYLSVEEEEDDTTGVEAAAAEETTSNNQVTSPATLMINKKKVDYGLDIGIKQMIVVDETEEENTINGVTTTEIQNRIVDARNYIHEEVLVDDDKYSPKIRVACKNKHEECAAWAARGECDSNPSYMTTNCAPVCRTCDLLDINKRCPLDPNEPEALQQPGDLNHLFERIVTDPWYQQYEPVVLSRPTYANGDNAENATYKLGMWLIMFDKALSNEEADRMIELGGIMGYERSQGVGAIKDDGTWEDTTSDSRTSSNAWCNDECFEDPIAKRLMRRVENITGIPEKNSESFQLLKYGPNEFYKTHNDYISHQRNRPSGVRVLTLYFYLNDVEEGGGTRFPKLNMTVTPQKGRAVLWPSVRDDRPHTKDGRSDHEALPVIKGVKYGCNAWIHMRDFHTPNDKGC